MLINVNDYKFLESDSDMINAAIKDSLKRGSMVVVPKYNERTDSNIWEITKPIVLESGTTVILNSCHMRMADGAVCRMFVNSNCDKPLTGENRQRDITIKGIGVVLLDGGVHNGIYEKNGIARKVPQKTEIKATENIMMQFKNVENLVIEGLQIKNQRYWAIALCMVSYSRVSNIRFFSDSNVPNQDGVGIHMGCHNVIVENISGCVGDNLIAICAIMVTDKYEGVTDVRDGDIRNITVRNIMGYGVGGCALIRLINHDGYKIYNVHIDNVIETLPWSETDTPVAQNPDLVIKTDDDGNIIPWKKLVPGEKGYRTEAAVIIGESYWYNKSKAQSGDTFGISVSNVMTHARFAIWINNTLEDSTFENIRLFGNGYMAVFFGEGTVENLKFKNIIYDKNSFPLAEDEHIYIDWNKTESHGFHPVYFNGTEVENVTFDGIDCCGKLPLSVGGFGKGTIVLRNVGEKNIEEIIQVEGINGVIQ